MFVVNKDESEHCDSSSVQSEESSCDTDDEENTKYTYRLVMNRGENGDSNVKWRHELACALRHPGDIKLS